MKKVRWLAGHMEEIFLVAAIAYVAGCMVLQVIMRRMFNNSLSWSEESIRYVFIWMMFLGLGIGVRDGKHIRISAIEEILPEKVKKILSILADFIFLGYACYIFYYGVSVALSFVKMPQNSPALGIPMVLVYLAAPVGFGLLVIRLAQKIVSDIRVSLPNRKA